MCGIVGYSCARPGHANFIESLIQQSSIRGLHSFGCSYVDQGEILTKKFARLSDVQVPQKNKLIFHNRYCTSGDYRNPANNQPIERGGAALVFNGVIDMGRKCEMEAAYQVKLNSENDGELLLAKCGPDPESIREFIKSDRMSFAGMILTQENRLFVIRNKFRPCWMLKKDGATFIASTRDIFSRADPDCKPAQIEAGRIYEI